MTAPTRKKTTDIVVRDCTIIGSSRISADTGRTARNPRVELTSNDLARLLDHARKQQARAVDGGGTFQFWTPVLAALKDATP